MKRIMKIFNLALAAVAALAVIACDECNKPELAGYPDTEIGFAIADVEGNPSSITLNATYDAQGVLSASGNLTRTYILSLESPSPEDTVFEVEPLIVGIPEEFVTIDKTELVIPAGSKSETVTVEFTGDDFSFAAVEAETYELGVRIKDIKGYKPHFKGEPEGKVIVEKVPYQSDVTMVIDGTNATSITFKRSYVDGKIINEDKMTLDFKAVLSRPALTSLEIPFELSGVPAGFESSVKFSSSSLKVAAGEKESSVVTLDIADDFVLVGGDNPESYPLLLQAVVNDDNPFVAFSADCSLAITVNKVLDLMSMSNASEFASLTRIEPNKPSTWTGSGDGMGSFGSMFDGVTTGYSDYYYFYSFEVDMKEVKAINGVKIYCYYSSISYMPNHFTIDVSEDGNSWMSLGEVEDGRSAGHPVHVMFLKQVKARYLKFTSLETSKYSTDFIEFELYGK